jgi:hypothetical protein
MMQSIEATEQFGFRPGASTEQASYRLTDQILKALNNRMMVGGIFCDLLKLLTCKSQHSINKTGV